MIGRHLKLFESLNRHGVEYLLIGGTLAIAYGVPRVTKDIDLFLRATVENASRCLVALKECGLGTAELTTPEELSSTEVTIFKDVLRLDVLTNVKGIEFNSAWRNKVFLELGNIRIPALSLTDLIASKQASGRPADADDIKILEMSRQQK